MIGRLLEVAILWFCVTASFCAVGCGYVSRAGVGRAFAGGTGGTCGGRAAHALHAARLGCASFGSV